MPNNIFKTRLSRATKIKIAVTAAVILAIIGYVVWDVVAGGPLTSLLSNKDAIVAWVSSHGILGPLAFVFLQILQTILAPIPGNVVGGVGGFIFGWWGILWTLIGSAIGFFIVFWLSRKFGRPLVEKLVKKESLDKFDFIAGRDAPFILFMIFLIPGLPDDVVCYLAGLTEVPIRKLMVLVLLGRLPAIVMTNYIGSGLGEESLAPVIVATVATVIIIAVVLWKKDQIMSYLRSKSQSWQPHVYNVSLY